MQADKVRAVAVTSLDRMPQLPDVEPLQNGSPELKGYELLNWFGLFTTAGTPAAVVNRYNEIATRRLAEPKIAETLSTQGIVPRKMSPEQFGAFVAAESQKFASVIEKARIKLDYIEIGAQLLAADVQRHAAGGIRAHVGAPDSGFSGCRVAPAAMTWQLRGSN